MASYYIGLSLLSNERQKPAINRKALHDEGRRILAALEGRPPESRPFDELDIAEEENGRPFFPDRRADFNISHSGNMAAVSFVKSLANGGVIMTRTGCDVEFVRARPNTLKIAEKYFSPAERDYIFPAEKPEDESRDTTRFFHIWTLKECYLKLRGLSVFNIAEIPSFISTDAQGRPQLSFCGQAASPLSFSLYELSGPHERYVLAAVVEGALNHQPEIRWFSQSLPAVRIIAEIKAEISPPETVRAKM